MALSPDSAAKQMGRALHKIVLEVWQRLLRTKQRYPNRTRLASCSACKGARADQEGRLSGRALTLEEVAQVALVEGGAIFQLPINVGSKLKQLPY
jgi:hypothetical protein